MSHLPPRRIGGIVTVRHLQLVEEAVLHRYLGYLPY
jgi:hypothetical protein